MKYPPGLYVIEVHFGPEIEPFIRTYSDATKAGEDLRTMKKKMHGSNAMITSIRLWHHHKIVSIYDASPPKQRWVWVPPPDTDGIRHIPAKTIIPLQYAKSKKTKKPVIAGALPTVNPDRKFEL